MKTNQPVSAAAVEPVNVLAKLLREVAAYVPKTAMYDEACTVHQIVAVALKAYEHAPSATPEAVRPVVCRQTGGECVIAKTQRMLGDPRVSVSMGCTNEIGQNAAASTAASAGEAVTWRCPECGNAYDGMCPSWRWSGERWQHLHNGVGYVDCDKIGRPTAPVIAPVEAVALLDTRTCGHHAQYINGWNSALAKVAASATITDEIPVAYITTLEGGGYSVRETEYYWKLQAEDALPRGSYPLYLSPPIPPVRARPAAPVIAPGEPVIFVDSHGLHTVLHAGASEVRAYKPSSALIMSMPLTPLYLSPPPSTGSDGQDANAMVVAVSALNAAAGFLTGYCPEQSKHIVARLDAAMAQLTARAGEGS